MERLYHKARWSVNFFRGFLVLILMNKSHRGHKLNVSSRPGRPNCYDNYIRGKTFYVTYLSFCVLVDIHAHMRVRVK